MLENIFREAKRQMLGSVLGTIGLIAPACRVHTTTYTPTQEVYYEGQSFPETCDTAMNVLRVNLPGICTQQSSVDEHNFSCNGREIAYTKIRRVYMVYNESRAVRVRESPRLYLSTRDGEEFVLTWENREDMRKVADALYILKNCER